MANCVTPTNSGGKGCRFNPGIITGMVIVPQGGEFANEAAALVLANWNKNVNAVRQSIFYPLPKFDNFENTQDDPIFYEGDTERIDVRSGNIRFVGTYANLSLCYQKMLKSFNGGDWYAYFITQGGYILGKSNDGVKFQPFKIKFYADNQKFPANNGELYMTKVFVDITNPDEWGTKGMEVKPTAFDAATLEGLTNVTLTLVSSSSTSAVVTIADNCEGAAISGLVVGDFILTDDVLGAESITSVTESSTTEGSYTFAWSTLGADDYILNLKAPSAQTTKGYESTAAVTFTI
jgi:hypothetical protein